MNIDYFFRIKSCLLLGFLCFYNFSFSQISDEATLFSIDGDKISVKEFLKVYNKNLDLVKDASQKEVDNYLDLYINYKLKVKEARRLGYDKEVSYQREFSSYRNQLSNNYLLNNEVTDELLIEAYSRLQQEIKAVHILIRLDQNDNDTIAVYNQLVELRDDLKNEEFSKLKKEYHNGEQVFVEDLGYFTAFKMVYPFESAAYNLEVGEVSMPFRTQFGFHIVKVLDKRKSRGEVTVSHIMITDNANPNNTAEQRIHEIYKKIKQGESFEILAKQFSEDKGTSDKGGLLSPFEGGQLSSSKFEEVSFGLQNPGDISEPFKTDFGWHIVRLENKNPLKPFDELEAELEVKVSRDSRSSLIDKALVKKLNSLYNVEINRDQLSDITKLVTEDYFLGRWTIPQTLDGDQILVSIDTLALDNEEFVKYLFRNQAKHKGKSISSKALVENELQEFVNTNLISFHKNNLENIDEDYAFILNEYKEGLLLFSLMEKEIWNKAAKDTLGLRQYYEANQENYVSPKRYKAKVITAVNEDDIKKAHNLSKKNRDLTEIAKDLNSEGVQRIFITTGEFTDEHPLLSKNLNYAEGLSKLYKIEDGFAFAVIDEIIPPGPIPFDQSRGRVISDYQLQLEQNWIDDLKKRYKVNVEQEVLTEVKQRLKNGKG